MVLSQCSLLGVRTGWELTKSWLRKTQSQTATYKMGRKYRNAPHLVSIDSSSKCLISTNYLYKLSSEKFRSWWCLMNSKQKTINNGTGTRKQEMGTEKTIIRRDRNGVCLVGELKNSMEDVVWLCWKNQLMTLLLSIEGIYWMITMS